MIQIKSMEANALGVVVQDLLIQQNAKPTEDKEENTTFLTELTERTAMTFDSLGESIISRRSQLSCIEQEDEKGCDEEIESIVGEKREPPLAAEEEDTNVYEKDVIQSLEDLFLDLGRIDEGEEKEEKESASEEKNDNASSAQRKNRWGFFNRTWKK